MPPYYYLVAPVCNTDGNISVIRMEIHPLYGSLRRLTNLDVLTNHNMFVTNWSKTWMNSDFHRLQRMLWKFTKSFCVIGLQSLAQRLELCLKYFQLIR